MENSGFKRIGVLGAGLMGHGIAQIFAWHGFLVNLHDRDSEVLQSALERIRQNFAPFARLDMVAPEEIEAAMGRITLSSDLDAFCQGVDLVFEAVSENLELKRKIFAALEERVSATAILCSNTSAISIGKIAQGAAHPSRILGTHFWNPPQVVPCVEVIKGPRTGPAVFETVFDLLAKVGKKPVKVLKDVPGFLGNRMQHALWREAIKLVEEGIASPEDVDDVVRYGFGLRLAFLGPLATADLAGLDLTREVQKDLFPHIDRSTETSPLLEDKIGRQDLGAKTGQGFHTWSPEDVERVISTRDEVLLRIIRQVEPPKGT